MVAVITVTSPGDKSFFRIIFLAIKIFPYFIGAIKRVKGTVANYG